MANFAQDDFSSETIDGTALNGNNDNLGNSWTQGHGSTNDIVVATTTSPHSVQNSASYTAPYSRNPGPPPGADYTVQCDLLANGTTLSSAGVLGRMSAVAQTYYVADGLINGASSEWRIYKLVAGTLTILNTTSTTFVQGTTYTIQLIMSGTSLTLVVNGVSTVTATDSSITAQGQSGITINGDSTKNCLLIQNFKAFPNAASFQPAWAVPTNFVHDGFAT